MASIAGRAAFRATRALRAAGPTAGAGAADAGVREGASALSKGARRDPELYTLGFIMTCAFAGAGYYFSTKPTSAVSENPVPKVPGSEPWNTGGSGKYQYHPGGDSSQGKKEAPSALNVVIVPDVTLPKYLHDKFNKYGKDDY
ncbi:MAG: hypothetical protein M1822_000878 [Bathelium mastoideum]|nr:MAG: hypothetical protein M1822_000878 [Bathelium mastoideum]